ncbi:MAG: anhydro-N-acetylmuramic acid kinase AnmK [Clostridium sp.]
MYAVGLMSGTSLDGVDAVLVKIEGASLQTNLEIMGFETIDIPEEIKQEIKDTCVEEKSSVDVICSLNFKLGYLFSEAVKSVCKKANFSIENLDFVASHGQTIYHIPKERNNLSKSTLQIGEPAVIAYETGALVVSNFRVMDIAAGGEGAPLVPFSEYILYGGMGKNIALQNIGGIGNVTVVPNTQNIDEIFAFDTGPGNMAINEACTILYGKSYDKDGEIAQSGKVNKELLDELMSHPYINMVPPKTTGREDFGELFVKNIIQRYKHLSSEDIVATFTMFTAKSIANNYKNFIIPKVNLDMLVVGGGGAHNKTLMKFIKEELQNIEVVTQDDIGYSSDAKEAIAFVILANETLHNSFSNVKTATGAKENVVLGNITPGKRGVFINGK